MSIATEDWSRPEYAPGGGDAVLFYLAFGTLGPVRLPPLPDGLSLTVHPQGQARLWVQPLVSAAEDGEQGPPGLGELVRDASDFAVLRGRLADPRDLTHLRDAESILAALLEVGAVAVLDVEARRWWTRDGFRAGVLGGERPSVRAHVSIRVWRGLVETRGCCKFGRPDLRLRVVRPGAEEKAVELCWALVERLARGVRPGAGFPSDGLRLRPCGDPTHPALEGDWPEPPLPRARSA